MLATVGELAATPAKIWKASIAYMSWLVRFNHHSLSVRERTCRRWSWTRSRARGWRTSSTTPRTVAINALFAFLFLIPFVLDPAISTMMHDFVEKPVHCKVEFSLNHI